MQRSQILRNTGATLDVVFSAGYADADAVTVTVTRGDGTTIVNAQAATRDAGTTGRYTYTLDPQADVDALTIVWAGTFGGVSNSFTSYADVVGEYLFALSELRSFDDRKLADTTAYPDATLSGKRAEIAEFFERECGVSFAPKYGREQVAGNGSTSLWLRRSRISRLLAVTVDNVALTSDQLADIDVYEYGKLYRPSGWPCSGKRNVVVEYEHGWQTPPAKISEAAMILARYDLVVSDLSDRTVSYANDLGQFRLSVPGSKYPTGIPTVDAVLERYTEEQVFIS